MWWYHSARAIRLFKENRPARGPARKDVWYWFGVRPKDSRPSPWSNRMFMKDRVLNHLHTTWFWVSVVSSRVALWLRSIESHPSIQAFVGGPRGARRQNAAQALGHFFFNGIAPPWVRKYWVKVPKYFKQFQSFGRSPWVKKKKKTLTCCKCFQMKLTFFWVSKDHHG